MHRLTTMLAILTVTLAKPALAEGPLELTFEGRVEPMQRVQIANQITGRISAVHVRPGQRVKKGELLLSIEDTDFKIDVEQAKAALAEAQARLALAEDVADRQKRLEQRGTGAEADATRSALQVEVAKAIVARSKAALEAAHLALQRTRIVAPISGIVQRTLVAPGAFVEAEGGTIVGELIQIDPVLVAYSIPYAVRQKALRAAGTNSVDELFGRIDLSLKLPSGATYPHSGKPVFESAVLDEKTGMLTTWGEFRNPENTLLPGLELTVLSNVARSPSIENNK